MGVTSLNTLFGVDIASAFVDQVQELNVSPGVSHMLESGDGEVFNPFVAVNSVDSVLGFSSSAIKTLLDKIGTGGFKIASGAVLTAFFQAVEKGGTRKAASSHTKLVVNEGYIIPTTLNVSLDGRATLGALCTATYDGTNLPIAVTESQSLVGTPTVDNIWTLGPATVFDTPITGIQSLSIDFGIDLFVVRGGEDVVPAPTFVAVRRQSPSITIVTVDSGVLANLTLLGDSTGATDVYLRHVAEGVTRVADATASHIKFTVSQGRAVVSGVDGSDGGNLGATIEITPSHDGSNDPIQVDTASAIT